MKNDRKTKNELIEELKSVRRKVKKMETLREKYKHTQQDITEGKHLQEESSTSEEYYRSAFETSHDGLLLVHRSQGDILHSNAYAQELLGYSNEEFSKNKLWGIGVVKDDKDFQEALSRLEKDGVVYYNNISVKNKAGLIVDTEVILVDKVKFIQCNIRDNTERKRAEEALKKSEEKYRSIFENVQDVYYETLFDGTILEVSPSIEIVSRGQYKRADLIGKSMNDFYADINNRHTILGALKKTGSVTDFEVRFKNRDGSCIPCSISAKKSFDVKGQLDKIIGSMHDITERNRTEEALQESETRYRSVLQSATDAIVTVDGSGIIIGWNSGAERIFGYSYTEAVGLSLTSIISLYHSDENFNGMNGFRSEGGQNVIGKTVEFKGIRKDKSVFPIELSLSTWETKSEQFFTGIIRDITERKRVEEELRNSESKFRTIFNSTSDGMFLVDLHARAFFLGNAMCMKMLGYTQEEFLTLDIDDIHPREDLPFINDQIEKFKGGEEGIRGDLRFMRKDGSIFSADLRPALLTIAEKKYLLINFNDITERKRVEQQIALLAHTLKSIAECVSITDLNDIVLFVNSAFLKMYGYTENEILGKNINVVRSLNNSPEATRGIIAATLAGGWSGELMNRTKDGRDFPVYLSTSFVRDEEGKDVALVGVATDITERKRAEEALQESELRFRSLYENTTIGLYRTTTDGNILLANPALVKMLGYTSFQKLAERNLEKEGFESSSLRKEFLEKIERDGEVQGHDSKWIRQDGKVIFVLESARAIHDSHGKTMYYDGTVEDITERRQMEEGLRQMQKLEGLGTLAGGIAHDFNNILGIILAYITSTEQFKNDAKKLDLAINTIVKAVERGKTLVQQILTFARKTETSFGAVNVNDVVIEIMVMIFETFPKTITYVQNFDKSISYINADRSQLHQALLNLCVNARDAMPKGGVLTINTHMVSGLSLRHQHRDAASSSYVCIEVIDTGEGMTEDIKKRIFEPFFTTKELGKGTGLGLAVVFGIAQTHKGFVDVESELGKGTTFRLYLLASQVAAPISVIDEKTLEEIPGGTETLLVVEDEEMLMMSLQMVLVEKGYKVLSAGDGLAAVNIYKERKEEIALVLTDLGLPNISGVEECAQIRKINPHARIIVATGYLDPGMKSEFLKARIQHFLFKPYDLKQVLKVIREVIDEK